MAVPKKKKSKSKSRSRRAGVEAQRRRRAACAPVRLGQATSHVCPTCGWYKDRSPSTSPIRLCTPTSPPASYERSRSPSTRWAAMLPTRSSPGHQAAATGHPVVLVGPPDLAGRGDLPLIPAEEVVAMDEDPAQAIRRKKDSTLVRAAEAVRDGKASAMISAGNTGATMAAALLRMGRIKGVSRPAIATPIPVPGSTPTVLLDAGANAEVQPEWLVQFAQMGSVFAQHRFALAPPGRAAVDRRGAGQGRPPAQGGVRLLRAARHRLHRQRRGPRRDDRRRRRRGHRRLHRQRRAEDARGWRQGGGQGPVARAHGRRADRPTPMRCCRPAPLYETLDPDTYGGRRSCSASTACARSPTARQAPRRWSTHLVAKEMVEHDMVEEIRRRRRAPDAES